MSLCLSRVIQSQKCVQTLPLQPLMKMHSNNKLCSQPDKHTMVTVYVQYVESGVYWRHCRVWLCMWKCAVLSITLPGSQYRNPGSFREAFSLLYHAEPWNSCISARLFACSLFFRTGLHCSGNQCSEPSFPDVLTTSSLLGQVRNETKKYNDWQ